MTTLGANARGRDDGYQDGQYDDNDNDGNYYLELPILLLQKQETGKGSTETDTWRSLTRREGYKSDIL